MSNPRGIAEVSRLIDLGVLVEDGGTCDDDLGFRPEPAHDVARLRERTEAKCEIVPMQEWKNNNGKF